MTYTVTTNHELEIPMALADSWDDMLDQKGRSATYWEIACWAYEQGKKQQDMNYLTTATLDTATTRSTEVML